jgi:hypothetical protein
MSTTSHYAIQAIFTGDINFSDSFSNEANDTSPAAIFTYDLALGPNTITVPMSAVGTLAVAALILLPLDNVIAITIKGVAGDVGILINPIAPHLQSLNDVASFVLDAADIIAGVRIIWL